jgi:hypothetical protein
MWSHSFGCATQTKACSYRNGGTKIIRTQAAHEEVDLPSEAEITHQEGVGLSFASDSSYWSMT